MSENSWPQVHDIVLFYHSEYSVHRLSFRGMPFHRHGLITCEHGTGKIPQLLWPVWQLIFLFFDVPTAPQFFSSEKKWKDQIFNKLFISICCGTESALKKIKINWNTAPYNYGNFPLLSSQIGCTSLWNVTAPKHSFSAHFIYVPTLMPVHISLPQFCGHSLIVALIKSPWWKMLCYLCLYLVYYV